MQRIDEKWIQDECHYNPVARSVLRDIKPGDLITLKRSLYTFYEEFRYAMHPQGFSFDNSRCAIFSLPASSQKDSGKETGKKETSQPSYTQKTITFIHLTTQY